jgi:UDPglucose 6-dehydrogenase
VKVTIFGTGYVGLVTGACLAEAGNEVLCVDIDAEKVRSLQRGEIPIHEPGLDVLVAQNASAGRLSFTTSAEEGVAHGSLIFIAVGTPPDEDGSADLSYVLAVARSIGDSMQDYKIIIDKSTVPVGTADRVRAEVMSVLATRGISIGFDVVSNPEFLKEGAAINDFMKPDRVVIGADSVKAAEQLKQLYAPFTGHDDKLLVMDVRSAELTKYAANAMLATKISFINELSGIAERVGADVELVRRGIGSDSRIGFSFINPGAGYGGSCFPKDVQALKRAADSIGASSLILQAVEEVNAKQKRVLLDRISQHFDGHLKGKTVAVWGLAFKPDTDDMREAPSRVLMEGLWAAGARVRGYDPVASKEAARLYRRECEAATLILTGSPMEALQGADVLAIVTEWRDFRQPDFAAIRKALRYPVIFDGRNLYEPGVLQSEGFVYYAIGRGASVTRS